MSNILKTGSSSIILGYDHYEGNFPKKENKLLKVTKLSYNHNEFRYLSRIRKIKEYKKYYSIPDEEITILLNNSEFYKKLIQLTIEDKMTIFTENLYCMYIDFAGTMDVIDSIDEFNIKGYSTVWHNINSILDFSKHIMLGLKFLHENKICHLDIKPENIMINFNGKTNKFKIIDFGFCSFEPFDDYVIYFKGTPGYFPCHFDSISYIQAGLPKIETNDMNPINGIIPMVGNRDLVYKIDSYCLGRVLYLIMHYYENNNIEMCCFDSEYRRRKKIRKIINLLLEKNVSERVTITRLLDMNII
jgi:serine/threonine protein kinase